MIQIWKYQSIQWILFFPDWYYTYFLTVCLKKTNQKFWIWEIFGTSKLTIGLIPSPVTEVHCTDCGSDYKQLDEDDPVTLFHVIMKLQYRPQWVLSEKLVLVIWGVMECCRGCCKDLQYHLLHYAWHPKFGIFSSHHSCRKPQNKNSVHLLMIFLGLQAASDPLYWRYTCIEILKGKWVLVQGGVLWVCFTVAILFWQI